MLRMLFLELRLDPAEALMGFQPGVADCTRVDIELRELASAAESSFPISHTVKELDIPSRRECWRITTLQGRRIVNTSRNQMERQILRWHQGNSTLVSSVRISLPLWR